MTVFVNATEAAAPKSKESVKVGIFLAGVFTVIALVQLTTFDAFIEILGGFNFPGGESTAFAVAAVSVVSTVFALPFLLRMRLSPAFRWLSMVFGWIAAVTLAKLAVWMMVVRPVIDTESTVGELLSWMPGWWMVFGAAALVILTVWASWGLWPQPIKIKK